MGLAKARRFEDRAGGDIFTKEVIYQSSSGISGNNALLFPWPFSGRPKLVQVSVICLASENGYDVGDEVVIPLHANMVNSATASGGTAAGYTMIISHGNEPTVCGTIYANSGQGSGVDMLATTGVFVRATASNWAWICRAWG